MAELARLPGPGPDRRGARSRLAGSALVVAAAASWGTWSLFLRPAHLPATVSTPIMLLVVGVVTLPAALRGPRVAWDRATVGLVVANAAFDALNIVAFFAALQVTTVEIAVLTHYFSPIFIALAAPRIDRVVTPGAGLAAAVALAGLVVILEPWHAPADGAVLGAALGVASAVCAAGNIFAVRRIAARIGAARALCYHALLGAAAMAPLAARHAGELTLPRLGLLAAGSATLGAASGVAFSVGLIRIGSARAAVLTYLEPLVAVGVGATVWHEPLSPLAAVGGLLVIGAGIEVARKAR
ncbi:MAG TPA: DMT family transporter [Kofleriaceae bacterium]|nr:DMT family transporter [Kofleriaceae bacterium]